MDRRDWLFIAGIIASIFIPMFSAFALSAKQRSAEQERARERRMAEHRMNARLLRLNI